MAAESILSAFLPVILEKVISPAIQHLFTAFGKVSDLQKLERILKKIQSVLIDAEERQTTNPSIQVWLSSLKNLSYEAEDVLEEFEFEAQRKQTSLNQDNNMRRKLFYYCSFYKPIIAQFSLCRRLNDIIQKIEKIAEEINMFNFQFNKVPHISYGRPQTHSYVDKENIIGREKDKEEIVSFLINLHVNKKKNIAVLPIVAMGGMGKTTLSQLVYSDYRVERHFQLRMWVSVSDADFDVARLVRLIIEAATKEECKLSNMELLQQRLRELISGKRCLIILDDVWNEDRIQWEKLKTLLDCGGEGSTVVVSTRSMEASKMMATTPSIHYLKQLSEEDCWELFRRRAFVEGAEELKSLVKIGKDIIKRCGGLPLAIDTLGSMMRNENDEEKWKAVLDNEIWKDAKNKILPALRLSYNYLPPHLKQCFVFCAIYPKDYVMEKDTLIELWMANGFIPSYGKEDLEIMGRDIFDQLVWRSFFQNVDKVYKYKYTTVHYRYHCITTCKMHDLMHDLAQSIMGKECFNFAYTPKWEDIPSTARHLAMPSLPKSSRSQNKLAIRTIVMPQNLLIQRRFQMRSTLRLKSLRVLRLRVVESVITIRHSKHLRWLDLSFSLMIEVPESICSLYNLQTLKLSHCINLKKLPDNLTDLVNLRHLNIDGCYNLAFMPRGMRRLKHLQTLTMYVVSTKADRGLEELCDLNLCGTLTLRGINKVSNVIDAQNAKLSSKKNLLSLSLNFEGGDSVDVFEALKPHDGLMMLEVLEYNGQQFSKWINVPRRLKNLVEINLDGCKKCKELPPFWQLPFLEVLHLGDMEEIKHIINKTIYCDGDLHTTFFPSLKKLNIRNMKNLESLPQGMKSLTSLSIGACSRIISLPEDLTKLGSLVLEFCNGLESLPQEIRSLTHLDIFKCNELISLPEDLTKLDYLKLQSCNGLESLPQEMGSLTYLSIYECNRLMSLPEDLPKLDTLDLFFCNGLKSLPQWMENLRTLRISRCKGITSLPEAFYVQLPNLSSLIIFGHDELIRPFQFGGNCWHLIENIPFKDIRLEYYLNESSTSRKKCNIFSLL